MSDLQRLFTAYLGMFLLAAGLCAGLLAILVKTGLAWRIAVDRPNERSLHSTVVPRCGGWGIIGTLLVFLGAALPVFWQVSAGVLLLALISFIDDRRGLPVWLRLVPQVAAVFIVLHVQRGYVPWLTFAVIGLGWLWLTNLYNFMDGSDGLAGTMTLIGFAAYAVLLGGAAPVLTMVSVVTAGAALGFLYFNWAPARIFLGDAGSIPLGFLAGAVGFLGYRDTNWPLWVPILLFSPFIADASVTLAKRAWRREKIWRAHREHYYQRLIQSGVSHRDTALVYGAAMLCAFLLAFFLRGTPELAVDIGLAAWVAVLVAIGVWIDLRVRRLRVAAAP